MFDNIRVNRMSPTSNLFAICSLNSEGMGYAAWFTDLGADCTCYAQDESGHIVEGSEHYNYYQLFLGRILHTHNN